MASEPRTDHWRLAPEFDIDFVSASPLPYLSRPLLFPSLKGATGAP